MEQNEPTKKYLDSFEGSVQVNPKKQKALELALDIRKFEIELYWKRATYFWAFTAAALTAFITVTGVKEFENRSNILLLVVCLGLVFSVAWYFVNRASKFWQNNWEKHVDQLEDDVVGPLYKTVIQENAHLFWKIESEYPFSVSKINQLLSLFMVLIYVVLLVNTLVTNFNWGCKPEFFPSACIIVTLLALRVLYTKGKTSGFSTQISATVRRTQLTSYNEEDG